MASAKASLQRAVTAHRQAVGLLGLAKSRLDRMDADGGRSADSVQQQTALAAQLESLAAAAAPHWLGEPWSVIDERRFALETDAAPGREVLVRIGDAQPLPGVGFPVVVPFVGTGHLAIDVDARDPAVAGLLRSVVARLLGAFPAGSLRILAVDGGALGAPLAPFRALVPAGVMNEPVTELSDFRSILEEAEDQVRLVQSGAVPEPDVIVIVAAALPPGCGRREHARLAALAHAGPAARVHLLLAGYPPPRSGPESPLVLTTTLTSDSGGSFRVGEPANESFAAGSATPSTGLSTGVSGGLNAPVALDHSPPPRLVDELCRQVALRAESEGVLEFDDLVPDRIWTESSVDALRTVIGRSGRADAVLALDDATPHWLVGGRTGSGKTVFLLDVLYGLAARYSPDELALYLLDFKAGISFAEFIPNPPRRDDWLPHARTVGIESDREYGLAVLSELKREMTRRASAMKQAGVSNLALLRAGRRDVALPRIVAVIDEFHVLVQGNDDTAKKAVALLEEVARQGRSYGVHLILASQAISGIEALYTKGQSVFGQFGLRVALSGGSGVLDVLNHAADSLPVGQVVLNHEAGLLAGNRRARFPDADQHSVALLRHRLWEQRAPGSAPPSVFMGYEEHRVEEDPAFQRRTPSVRRRSALIGRLIDVGPAVAEVTLDASPGRHLAVVGTSPVGADVLHAATLSLARQHDPGTATFLLAGLVPAADDVVDAAARALERGGHHYEVLALPGYRDAVTRLASTDGAGPADRTYLVVFGADAASGLLAQKIEGTRRTGLDDLRRFLRDGPMRGQHLLGWWRGVRRLTDDLGSGGKDEISAVLALNVRGADLNTLFGRFDVDWSPRPNRALLLDRIDDTRRALVPFVRPGRADELVL